MEKHSLGEVVSEAELHNILKKVLRNELSWQLVEIEVKSAVEGMAGFLGDHFRLTLHVLIDGRADSVKLFVKTVPLNNKPKAQFINDMNIFAKEAFVFKLLEELNAADGQNPWSASAYLVNENAIVMPDLDVEGYRTIPNEPLDLPHVLVVISAMTKFHASVANYETRRSDMMKRPYSILQQHSNMLNEVSFSNSDWMRAGAKLTADFLKTFSQKYCNIPNLEPQLSDLFVKACYAIKPYDGTLNTLVHRDLWSNNIMFKYNNGVPVNAIILDFQLIRYVPPSFDVTSFLYLTTSRNFRAQYEEEVYETYYSKFMENITERTKQKLTELNYNFEEFREWCNKSRLFAIVLAIMIMPYILVDPKSAKDIFDDPDTFEEYLNVDRSQPVIEYAKNNTTYRERFLEVCEEIVEKFVLNIEDKVKCTR